MPKGNGTAPRDTAGDLSSVARGPNAMVRLTECSEPRWSACSGADAEDDRSSARRVSGRASCYAHKPVRHDQVVSSGEPHDDSGGLGELSDASSRSRGRYEPSEGSLSFSSTSRGRRAGAAHLI